MSGRGCALRAPPPHRPGKGKRMLPLLLPLLAAFLVGRLLDKLKIPGGMMVGAVLGACAVHLIWGMGRLPAPVKWAAQVIAGGFIGSSITKKELRELRSVAKPALVLIPGLFAVNVVAGVLMRSSGKMDIMTALLSAAPGGVSDIPMIAADMDADVSIVMVMQVVRFLMGIGLFPTVIRLLSGGGRGEAAPRAQKNKEKQAVLPVAYTMLVAAACGAVGKWSGLPAGAMSFAAVGAIVFKLAYEKAAVPRAVRKTAQCLSGAYVGAGIGLAEIQAFGGLSLPILALVAVYSLGCFLISRLLYKLGLFNKTESLLASTPAGASDMALIAADLGVSNVKLILLQILRMLIVITLFPTLFSVIAGNF